MKKSILTLTFLSIVFFAYSQVTQYSDRTAWQNASSGICFSEDFESFNADTEFRTTSVQLNGFTLGMHTVGVDFGSSFNLIDVSPLNFDGTLTFTTNHAYLGTGSGNQVILTFDEPVLGFFADYKSVSNDGRRTVEFYNNDVGMIDSYEFPGTVGVQEVSHGFIAQPNMPVTNIVFNSFDISDGYAIDNIEISCASPIPTLSQWGMIALFMIMLIFGVIAMRQRKVSFG